MVTKEMLKNALIDLGVAIIYCTWLGKIKNEKPEDIG